MAIARIAGIALRQDAHAGDGSFLAAGGAVQGLIVGQGNIAIGRTIAIELAIDAHGFVGLALAGQFACLAKRVALRADAGQGLNLGDIRIVGVDRAQAFQRLAGFVGGADQLEIFGQAGEGLSVLGSERRICCQIWMAISGRPRDSRAWAFCTKSARVALADLAGLFWASPIWSASIRQPTTMQHFLKVFEPSLISASILLSVPPPVQTGICRQENQWQTGRDSDRNMPSPSHTIP